MTVINLEVTLSEGVIEPIFDQEHLIVRLIVIGTKLNFVEVFLHKLELFEILKS